MKRVRTFLCLAPLVLAGQAYGEAPAIDWALDDAIKQIDRQADDFKTAMMQVEVVVVDSEGEELSRRTGTGFMHKNGDARYNVDNEKRTLLLDGRELQIYDQEAGKVEIYSLRKHKDRLEPFLGLGFSITGRDMEDDYLVTILSEEHIGGRRTLVLELTPEKSAVREQVKLVKLWIDQASWMPVRQSISSTASGETVTVDYSSIARNLKLNPDLFKDRWPRGTEKIKK